MNIKFVGNIIDDIILWDEDNGADVIIATKNSQLAQFNIFDLA